MLLLFIIFVVIVFGNFFFSGDPIRTELRHFFKRDHHQLLVFQFFMAIAATFIVAPFIYCEVAPNKTVTTKEERLVSVKQGMGMNGQFYLLGGSFNSTPHYLYYGKTGENNYKRFKIKSKYTTIHYIEDTANVDPYIKVNEKRVESPFNSWWLLPRFRWTGSSLAQKDIHIYIPKGSIKKNYRVNDRSSSNKNI